MKASTLLRRQQRRPILLLLVGCFEASLGSGCHSPTPSASYTPPHYVKKVNSRKVIIFVHGVIGDAEATWTNPRTNASWPDLLANDPDMPGFDVFTYGYFSPAFGNASNIYEIATRFGQEVKDWNFFSNYDEIYFITHSMGGLITKEMLDMLDTPSDSKKLYHVRAAIFVSVPSNGADVSALASWISLNPQFRSMNPNGAVDFLQSVEGQWQSIFRARTSQEPFPLSYVAYETLPTHNVRVVPTLYTSHEADSPPLGFDYDHISIVKPPDRNSDVYLWAKARILEA